MKKRRAHRDQKRPSLLVPKILEMGWFLQTLNLCLKDKIKVHFSNTIVFLFTFKSKILSKLYCRIGIEETFYKQPRRDIVFAYLLAASKSSSIACESWNKSAIKNKRAIHRKHFLSRRSTTLTHNGKWQSVAWSSKTRCGASSSEILEGNITPILNLCTAKGLFTSFPIWRKTN